MILAGTKRARQEDKSNHLNRHRQRFMGHFFSSDKNRSAVRRRLHVRFLEVSSGINHNVASTSDKEKFRI